VGSDRGRCPQHIRSTPAPQGKPAGHTDATVDPWCTAEGTRGLCLGVGGPPIPAVCAAERRGQQGPGGLLTVAAPFGLATVGVSPPVGVRYSRPGACHEPPTRRSVPESGAIPCGRVLGRCALLRPPSARARIRRSGGGSPVSDDSEGMLPIAEPTHAARRATVAQRGGIPGRDRLQRARPRCSPCRAGAARCPQ
jgi:hypothetical protein